MSASVLKDELGKLVINASTYMQGIDAFAVKASAASVYLPINSVNQYSSVLEVLVVSWMINMCL